MLTVEGFIRERYWPKIKPTLCLKWQVYTEALLEKLIKGIGQYDINNIPMEEVDGFWHGLRIQYTTPVTPNKVLTRAKHVFKTAIRWKLCLENPFTAIRKEREPERAFTALSSDQHKQLLENASEKLQWYIVFAQYTGARCGSLGRLEERDIDLSTNTITFRVPKNKETYSIPIHSVLIPWLTKALTGSPTRLLLPQYKNIHSVSQMFRQLKARVKIKGFRFHDYRHNVGSQLAMKGYDVKVRMQMLGHKDPKMALRYTHIAQSTLKGALEEAL